MLKGKPAIKSKTAPKSSDKLRKQALATIDANLARIDAGEKGKKTGSVKGAAKTKAALAVGKKPKPEKASKEKRMSGLDAAAKVLVESKEPLNTVDMVKAMESKGYWTSPGGKTPHATLHAAISREIKEKGKESRFKKVDRGMFAAAGGK